MRAPLSIIIPTLNAADELPASLARLTEGLRAGILREVVVSDGGSQDMTLAQASDAGALVVTGPPGRGGQLARGAAAAEGEWLLFLHADTHLPNGWADTVLDHMASNGAAACFRLGFRAPGLPPRLVAGWANLRSRLGLPYGDQGLLIPAADYHRAGGFHDLPLMEDVELVRRLPGRVCMLNATATTSAGRYLRNGWLRQSAANTWRLVRYLRGTDPEILAREYRR